MREETVDKVAKAQAAEFARDIEPKLHMGGAHDSTDTVTIGARNYGRWEIKSATCLSLCIHYQISSQT